MKTVCPQGRVGSNPTLSVGQVSAGRPVFIKEILLCFFGEEYRTRCSGIGICRSTQEAEGTPLERVQVVNSGARVQIPPSALGTTHDNVKACQKPDEVKLLNQADEK